MVTLRNEVSAEATWNVEFLFSNLAAWQQEFDEICPTSDQSAWPELMAYKGRLGEGPTVILEALTNFFNFSRKLEKLYTYAHLRHDEDITNSQNKIAYEKSLALLHQFAEKASWLEPEILSLSQGTLQVYLDSTILNKHHFFLEKLVRLKEHTLTADQESLMALAHRALESPQKTFSAINNADFKFPSVLDSTGKACELTHGTYQIYLRSRDRTLRENAFKTIHRRYGDFENTLSELIQGQVQTHLFEAKARRYTSCLDASLYPKNIDTSVYRALIEAVRENIGALHNYVSLRKRILGIEAIHLYDLYVPLTSELDIKMDYDEAVSAVIASVAPLGDEYQSILANGLKQDRWVDRYENKNKRSGAYSSGCFDSMPYILMNYKGILNDVFTLAHEAGHSMHSYLSRKNQPYHYSSYPIFVAEVASTFNEELLMTYLKKHSKSKQEQIYLLNQQIETIRTTLFRQTMFAEFELLIHEFTERNIPLTPDLLKAEYLKLNQFYFGDSVIIDQEIEAEWSRIPHFYYNFYVYQYATGISASISLAEKVLHGGAKDRDHYLSFLKGGCSQYPINLLQIAGVDMRTATPVKSAIGKFQSLIKELSALLD